MTVSPVDGRLYISDYMKYRIIRIATMGPVKDLKSNFEVIAGTGEECPPMALDKCGDGKRAKDARLVRPKGKVLDNAFKSTAFCEKLFTYSE